MPLPTLFISHGSPALLVEDSASRDFFSTYGRSLGKPRAIVIASAHFGTSRPAVVGDAKPGMTYDFGGMPELRALVYPAPGDPVVAAKIAELLQAAGFTAAMVTGYGYDHGTWVPLMLLYPDADVPVVQLSVQPHLGPAHHVALGRALSSLKDDGFLVIGSGSATHNLDAFYSARHASGASDAPPRDWVADFMAWMHERIEAGRLDDLMRYRKLAPHAVDNHPTEEHLLPLFIAIGAARDNNGRRVHSSYRSGVISMDTYAFG